MSASCKEKGYKAGQVFERISMCDPNRERGALLVLVRDDDDTHPMFLTISGTNKGNTNCHAVKFIKRIYPPEEEKSKDVEVTCEGKTVTISRESAKALNLCD